MKKGLTSNGLKIIAIITMIIDHIGYYLYPYLDIETYYLFRSIGRISMPLFAFLIVQGFFHTRNLKKYIYRILGLAIITQICLNVLNYINIKHFPLYATEIHTYLNILFSYTLSLILLGILNNKNKNLFINILIFILIILTYLTLNIDYGMRIPFIMISLYFIEKLCPKDNLKGKLQYLSLMLVCFILSLTFVKINPVLKYSMLISLLFIGFYNGEKGKNNKFLQYLFYAIFPIHHTILYLLAMFL